MFERQNNPAMKQLNDWPRYGIALGLLALGRHGCAALAALTCTAALAFTGGSPVCTITPASMNANMGTSTVTSPNGWSFNVPATYTPGAATSIAISHADPGKQFRGILLWLTRPDGASVGTWATPSGFKLCQSSLTQTDKSAKPQQAFSYTPPSTEATTLTAHAVLVEECGLSSCRSAHPFLTAVMVPSVGVMNIDASAMVTRYDPGTDGVLLLRYLFGYTGTALTSGALGSLASRDAAEIVTHLNAHRTLLDVDADGNVYAQTDGLLILRYLLGLRDDALMLGARAGSLTTAQITTNIALIVP